MTPAALADLFRHPPSRDPGDRDRVRDASDIVRIVGEVVALRPKGREYVGLCPFHDDHKPSMYVVPSKQIFNCFVCGAGGDVFTFVQKYHKMDFVESLRYLAERAGITLTQRRPTTDSPDATPRSALLDACATAADFFRAILAHPEHGQTAREVVARRGLSPEIVRQFQIGASPARWDGLLKTIQSRGMDPRPFVDAGLLKHRDQSGGLYDVFRNRLVFPIHDQVGRVIAFGGRRIDDADEPKYLNSPETRLFNKSATLFALSHAARAIQSQRTAIITEGYTDAIACHQAGVANAVATLGTALTRDHAAMLRRLCDRVILLFDGDDAGRRAADRAVEIFFAEPIDVSIATLADHTDAKDPDELLKRPGGRDVFDRAIAGATDVLEYRFSRLRARLQGGGMAALSKGVDEEIAWLAQQGLAEVPPIRQRLIIRRLASLAGVDEATITRVVPAGRRGRPAQGPVQPDHPEPSGAEPAGTAPELLGASLLTAEHLLGCVLCDGTLYLALPEPDRDLIVGKGYRSTLVERLAQFVDDLAADGETPDLARVLRHAPDEEVKSAAVNLASRIDAQTDRDPVRLRAHWAQCLTRARQDRARIEIKPNPAPGHDLASAAEALRIARESRASLGPDRRVLPRPG